MDEKQRAICAHLRTLSSAEAADWLFEHYPTSSANWGVALQAIPHRSWERCDQIRLAQYYLAGVPFASARGYEVFASFMSVPNLLAVLREYIPTRREDKQLLGYHLAPVLRRIAKSERDRAAAGSFLEAIGCNAGGI